MSISPQKLTVSGNAPGGRNGPHLALLFVLGACVVIGLVWQARAQQAQNPVQMENARAGTTQWRLGNSADNQEIEG
jgi:hypothetical protein